MQEGAVNLLCTVLNLFPSSLQKNYDSVSYMALLQSLLHDIVYIIT